MKGDRQIKALSIVSGLLMGTFYPNSLGPYAVAFVFALGVALCSLPVNAWLMRHSLTNEVPSSMQDYRAARGSWHMWGIAGGAIWRTGAVASFVASRANLVGPAVSYAIGQGATMVSAVWGVFVWREFAGAPHESRRLLLFMFVLFLLGLGAIAIAPLFTK
jgi:glucose uptake protein